MDKKEERTCPLKLYVKSYVESYESMSIKDVGFIEDRWAHWCRIAETGWNLSSDIPSMLYEVRHDMGKLAREILRLKCLNKSSRKEICASLVCQKCYDRKN